MHNGKQQIINKNNSLLQLYQPLSNLLASAAIISLLIFLGGSDGDGIGFIRYNWLSGCVGGGGVVFFTADFIQGFKHFSD